MAWRAQVKTVQQASWRSRNQIDPVPLTAGDRFEPDDAPGFHGCRAGGKIELGGKFTRESGCLILDYFSLSVSNAGYTMDPKLRLKNIRNTAHCLAANQNARTNRATLLTVSGATAPCMVHLCVIFETGK